jgi:hypothetical protein
LDAFDALHILHGRCATDGIAVATDLLDRLRRVPEAVVEALGGRRLLVRLSVAEPDPVERWVVFTEDGHVSMVSEAALAPRRPAPDVVLQGTGRSILATLLRTPEPNTVALIPLVPTERFDLLLHLVARQLLDLAAPGRD